MTRFDLVIFLGFIILCVLVGFYGSRLIKMMTKEDDLLDPSYI